MSIVCCRCNVEHNEPFAARPNCCQQAVPQHQVCSARHWKAVGTLKACSSLKVAGSLTVPQKHNGFGRGTLRSFDIVNTG